MLLELPHSLLTERLELRAPRTSDAAALRTAIADSLERLAPQLSWAQRLLDRGGEVPDLTASAAAAVARFGGGEEPSYFIFCRAESALVGELLIRSRGDSCVELGIWIRTGFQGRGIAMEACRAVLPVLHALGARKLVADCRADNLSATRLLEAAGFRPAELHDDRVIHQLELTPAAPLTADDTGEE